MRIVILSALLACSVAGYSQAMPAVDDYVLKEMKRQNTPAVSIAIVRDGKIAYAKGYGVADLENQVPATSKTVYEIGSVTKQFTATLVMKLVEEGKVKLDESIRTYLPETPESWKDVTVRHLLTHTSGIKSYTDVAAFGEKALYPVTPESFLEFVKQQTPDFKPGESWKYNNSGFFLLGLLIEKLEGKPYGEVLKARIFNPLGMTSTTMNDPAEIIPNRAKGYSVMGATRRNAPYIDMGWPYAAGALVSTVEDLAKWDAALYGESILKQSSLKQMWTPVKLNTGVARPYGFGWSFAEANGVQVIEHGGAIPGFKAMISRYPSKKLTVIVLANAINFAESTVAHNIAAIVDPSLKEKVVEVKDADPKLTAAHRAIFESVVAGKLNRDLLTDEMKAKLTPAMAEQAHQQMSALGSLTSFELAKDETVGEIRTRVYRVNMGSVDLKVTISTNKAGKIAGLLASPG
jgi:D-alanyl-D-alanine carboxypeptidase